jgi:hypothetical protein
MPFPRLSLSLRAEVNFMNCEHLGSIKLELQRQLYAVTFMWRQGIDKARERTNERRDKVQRANIVPKGISLSRCVSFNLFSGPFCPISTVNVTAQNESFPLSLWLPFSRHCCC